MPRDTLTRAALPRRVLITGGAGFVGAALAHQLAAQAVELLLVDDFSSPASRARSLPDSARVLELDICAAGALERALLDEADFDVCVHLAARVGVRTVLQDCEGARRANVLGVERLIESIGALAAARRPRVFFASTSEVYRPARSPLSESAPLRDVSEVGRFAYAASKLQGEQRLAAASELWSSERAPVCLRFFNVVGPGQDASSGMVLPSFIEQVLSGQPVAIYGDGSAVRTYAHVDEVARTLCELFTLPELAGGALNLGGRARASVCELALMLERALGRPIARVHIDPRRTLGPEFEEDAWREPDLTRIEQLGVHVPALDLERIVQDTLARHRPRVSSSARALEDACASRAS